MKTILENGARPVSALGRLSARRVVRSVDWARSFSSLTKRKSHNGLRLKCSDPDSRLCQEPTRSSMHVAGKTFPKPKNPRPSNGVPSAIHPLHPGEQNHPGSPEFIAVSPLVHLE